MTKRVRAVLVLIVALAAMGLANCDHYNCSSGLNFGASTCTASAPGLGSSTSGGSATAAFVFAVDTGTSTAGTIDGYTLNTSANTFGPTPSYTAPAIPGGDLGAGMAVAQSQFLYAGFGSTETIYGWSIGTAGTLTAINGSPYAAPFMSTVGFGPGSVSMITNPAGTLLFFADTFQDEIVVYQIGTDGALTAGSTVSVPLSPVNMTTDGLGKYLYVTQASNGHVGSEVAAYVIGSTGSLTAVPGSPFVGTGFTMWQVQGEPTGKFLIGTTGRNLAVNGADDDHLYVFSIAQSGANAGAITPVGTPVVTQFSPFSIAVQSNASGNLVYSFSLNDTETGFNGIEGYQLSSTGTLTAVTGSPFAESANGSWGQFDQSGSFLFAYGAILNESTDVVTAQLGPLAVGSGGVLTEPISSLTLATPGFWVVTDPK
ncbi:MAG: hypothetical protein WB660_25415 [Candidatus Sulfotelmatobacter sp.]